MDVLKARLTEDFRISRSPMCTGRRKSMWSMDAVTTWLCECLCAASAPAMSMKCISLPPSRLPSGFASFGRTTSAICDCDSLTARGGTMWIGVSRPSFEFILSFSHEGFSYRAMTGKVSRCLALRREHGSGPCRDVTDRPFAWKFHPGGRLPSLVVHFIRVLRVDLRPDPWGHLCQLGLAWPLFKINIYVAFSLALQARIAHGCQPAL